MSAAKYVAVVGAGAIGGFFAAQARLAGHEIILCTRTPTNRIVLESEGETHQVNKVSTRGLGPGHR